MKLSIILFFPTQKATDKEKQKDSEQDEEHRSFLDATVLVWIYNNISNDLLHTILELDTTIQQVWERL